MTLHLTVWNIQRDKWNVALLIAESVNFPVRVVDPVQPSDLTDTEVALVHNG